MKKIFCFAVLMSLCAWSFALPNYTSHRETRNLVGAKRLPHKKLTPGQAALKNVIALAVEDWTAYCETLPPEQAAEWRKNSIVPSGGKMKRGQAARLIPRIDIVYSKKKSGAMIVVVDERFPNLTKRYTMTLEKTRDGWIVVAKEEESLSSILRK